MQSPFLTVAEAAAFLRISRATLFAMIAKGAIPSVRIGARRLFRRSDLLQFVAELPTEGGA